MRASLLLLIGTLGATVAAAQAVHETATGQAGSLKEKKICRSDTATGSIRPTRTCHTTSEWKSIDAAARDNAAQFNNFRNNNMSPDATRG